MNPPLDEDERDLFPINFPAGLRDDFHHVRPSSNYAMMGERHPPIRVPTGKRWVHGW